MKLEKLVVISGPTASGKSDLSIKLSKKFNGEIVSADSRQIYKGLDIGTAKVKKKERGEILHYLIDIRKPNQFYTASQYKKEAIGAINKIIKKRKVPFLVGGTGLYIKSIVDNLKIPEVKPDLKLRKGLEQKIEKIGLRSVYEELIRIDPEAAYIVDEKNPRRVIRALEVALKTKKPFSELRKKGEAIFNTLQIALNPGDKELKKRVTKRTDKMVKDGLLKEVKNLIKIYDKNISTFDAIGYREIIDYFDKKYLLEEAISKINTNSWRYAKKQMSWFKKDPNVHWVKNQKEAEKLIYQFLK